jgi:hypothetical protein
MFLIDVVLEIKNGACRNRHKIVSNIFLRYLDQF